MKDKFPKDRPPKNLKPLFSKKSGISKESENVSPVRGLEIPANEREEFNSHRSLPSIPTIGGKNRNAGPISGSDVRSQESIEFELHKPSASVPTLEDIRTPLDMPYTFSSISNISYPVPTAPVESEAHERLRQYVSAHSPPNSNAKICTATQTDHTLAERYSSTCGCQTASSFRIWFNNSAPKQGSNAENGVISSVRILSGSQLLKENFLDAEIISDAKTSSKDFEEIMGGFDYEELSTAIEQTQLKESEESGPKASQNSNLRIPFTFKQ
eukprot:Platyproteum_vivax@DN15969_c0_g1_i1.p1